VVRVDNPELAPRILTDRWSAMFPPVATKEVANWRFGLVMFFGCALISSLILLAARPSPGSLHRLVAAAVAGTGSVLLVWSLIHPPSLRPVRTAWLHFGERAGSLTGLVILTLIYLLVVTPVGLLMRLLRVDPLGRSGAATYWNRRPEALADNYVHMS